MASSGDETEALEVQLPLSKVKKIARKDDEVKTISAEATWLLAAAAEHFLSYLTQKAYTRTEKYQRKTVQPRDILAAFEHEEEFEFLDGISLLPEERLEAVKAAWEKENSKRIPTKRAKKPKSKTDKDGDSQSVLAALNARPTSPDGEENGEGDQMQASLAEQQNDPDAVEGDKDADDDDAEFDKDDAASRPMDSSSDAESAAEDQAADKQAMSDQDDNSDLRDRKQQDRPEIAVDEACKRQETQMLFETQETEQNMTDRHDNEAEGDDDAQSTASDQFVSADVNGGVASANNEGGLTAAAMAVMEDAEDSDTALTGGDEDDDGAHADTDDNDDEHDGDDAEDAEDLEAAEAMFAEEDE